MSRQDIVNAAFKAWQVAHPYGQVDYLTFIAAENAAGRYWGA